MECINPRYLHIRDITVPCGCCGFCLATRRSDWIFRLWQEHKQHLDAHFITLTYANPHLTWRNGNPQLVKADLQKWFRCVRDAGYRIRYFAVGEYGSETLRPHYHVLLFGSVPETFIRKSWDKGLVHIGQVTQSSVAYCTSYVVNSKVWHMKKNRTAPFATMSLKPGIGSNYLTPSMKEWHLSGLKNYVVLDGNKRHLPRFYKEKLFSKINRIRISNRAQRDSLENLRKELYSMRNYPNALEYRDEMLRNASVRIKSKAKQKLIL